MASVDHLTDFDIDEVIEHTCWSSDKLVAPYVGGHGTAAERRSAVLAAYRAQEITEEAAERHTAFAIEEGPALDRIDAEMRRLAAKRYEFDPSCTEGEHLVRIGRHLFSLAEGWADIIDNDPLEPASFEPDDV